MVLNSASLGDKPGCIASRLCANTQETAGGKKWYANLEELTEPIKNSTDMKATYKV